MRQDAGMTTRPSLPPTVRPIAEAVADAVQAAQQQDSDAFSPAAARLATLGAEQVRRVLTGVLRPLLEDLHPDGLSGDDLRAVVEACVRRVGCWAEVDPQLLVVVLAGVFGVHPDDEDRPEAAGPDVLLRHACLLAADLLTSSGTGLSGYLDAAFAEIFRAEHHDDA
jgi:hypothetical protein